MSFHLKNEVRLSTQEKNENRSVITEKKTKWSVHLEVIETQEYLVTFT